MYVTSRLLKERFRQSGGATAEFLFAAPVLLLLGLGSLQTIFFYDAKTTLNYAAFEAARVGAVSHAQRPDMRNELGVRLSPIFGGDGSASEALQAMAESNVETHNPLFTRIQVLNPTREAFEDFAAHNPENGKREIPNDNLRFRSRKIGERSGVSIQDANLLKIKVTYGYALKVPVISTVLPAIMKWVDPANIAFYAAGRIPMTAVATVRMQSAAWPDDNASAGSGSTGGVPPETSDPGESQPPGGDADNGSGDADSNDDDGGDADTGSGNGDASDSGNGGDNPGSGDTGTGGGDGDGDGGDGETGDPGDGAPDCANESTSESTGTATGLPAQSVGNPINVTNGNKYQRETDLSGLGGSLPLYFNRHYNSHSRTRGPLGVGWRHSFQLGLAVADDRIELTQSDGRLLRFDASSQAGRYPARLAADGEVIADADGYLWRQPEGKRLRFNREGQLQTIRWRGKQLQLGYGERGRLAQVSDSQGRLLRFAYNTKGRLASITDPAGGLTRYRYDKRGNLEFVTRPDGRSRRYRYEDLRNRHLLTGITDERNVRYATWTYDDQGRANSSQHAEGVEEVHLDYTTPGQTRVTDSQGRVSLYTLENRDGIGHVMSIQGPGCSSCGGGDVSYRYNDRHQVTERQGKDGTTDLYRYDDLGRITEILRQQPGQPPRTLLGYRYEGESRRPASVIRPSVNPRGGHRLEVRYNPELQPVELTERGWSPQPDGGYSPIERTTRLAYDPAGNLVEIDGPREDVADITRLAYDDRQRLRQLTTPDGRTLQVKAYDDAGRPREIEASGRERLHLDYDAQGNLAEVRQGARRIGYAYDLGDRLTAITDSDGRRLSIEYDAAGRATDLEAPDGRHLHVTLDHESRPAEHRLSDASGTLLATVSYLYDAQGRLDARQDDRGKTRYHYADGRLQAIEGPGGRQTELAYNGLGQLLAITQPERRVTRFQYDAAGQTIGLTDPRDNTTRLLKDDFGNLVSRSHPDSGTTRYEHDTAGNLIARTGPDGRTTSYVYDAANRLIEERTPEAATRLDYDPQTGRLAGIDDGQSRESFSYNDAGRLTGHTREIDGHRFTSAYAYDSEGHLSQKTLPDGQRLDYHYYTEGKQKGQLRAITRGGLLGFGGTPLVGEIDTDASDRETGLSFGNGIRETRRYDDQGRLQEIRHQKQLQLRYAYDPQGRIQAIDLDGMIQRYAYDPWGRLSQAETRLGDYRYRYDPLGNRTQKQHTDKVGNKTIQENTYPEAGQGNRLLSQGDGERQDYHYNPAGSPERIGKRRYKYNAQQRPIKVYRQTEDGKETLLADYTYNRFGERIKKVVYSQTSKPKVTYYLYDGHQLSAEADGTGKITAQYLYLEERPVIKLEGERAYAIHTDHLGAPRAVTDEAQHIVWQADYSPFGLVEIGQEKITLNLRLPGQYADEETGTYYNYRRDYDPNTGRYLTSDPIGLKGGLSLYAYVENNPLGRSDSRGLAPDDLSVDASQTPSKPTATSDAAIDGNVITTYETAANGEMALRVTAAAQPSPNPACPQPPKAPLPSEIPGWKNLTAANDPNFTPEPGAWIRFGKGFVSVVALTTLLTGDTPRPPLWIEGNYEYELHEQTQQLVVFERQGVISLFRDYVGTFDLITYLGNTYFKDGNDEIVGVVDPETGAVSDAFISPEGIPFPSEENYRIAKQEYGDYLANGGELSFQDWLAEGRPEVANATFATDDKLLDHFNRHGSDFNASTPEEYQRMASQFLTGTPEAGVLEKTRSNGDIVRFNPATDEFGVLSKDGIIRTYYKPDPSVHGYPSNLDYYNAQ